MHCVSVVIDDEACWGMIDESCIKKWKEEKVKNVKEDKVIKPRVLGHKSIHHTRRMRATLVSSARRLFVPSQHMWLEASRMQKGGSSSHLFREGAWLVNVGLTDRALDDIGDVLSMDSLLSSSSAAAANNNMPDDDKKNGGMVVERGQTMMEIKWDGHAITSADELYHTVWENVEGMTPLQSPVSGLLQTVMMIPRKGVGLDEEDVLATIIVTDEQSLQNELQSTVDEEKYMQYLEQETLLGAFSEQTNDDSTSSSFVRQ